MKIPKNQPKDFYKIRIAAGIALLLMIISSVFFIQADNKEGIILAVPINRLGVMNVTPKVSISLIQIHENLSTL